MDTRAVFFSGAPEKFSCSVCGFKIHTEHVIEGRYNVYLPSIQQIFGEVRQDLSEVNFSTFVQMQVLVCAKCGHEIISRNTGDGLWLYRLEDTLERVLKPAYESRAKADAEARVMQEGYANLLKRLAGSPSIVRLDTARERRVERRANANAARQQQPHRQTG